MPDDSNRSSDSAPNFDRLRQQDRGPVDENRPEISHDSTVIPHDSSVDMLPPELEHAPLDDTDDVQPPAEESTSTPSAEVDDENGSSTTPAEDVNLAIDQSLEAEDSESEDPADNVLVDSPDDAASTDEQPISDAPTRVSLAAPVAAAPSASPVDSSDSPTPSPMPSPNWGSGNLLLILLASYASAATIALVYLITSMSNPTTHDLESLPDKKPLKEGEVALVPIDAGMPPGHDLRIGESCRYGNILVEPLRVVEEPIEFVHFSGSASSTKEATAPVFKMFLRFTNVSDDQIIAPLDRNLVFNQVMHDDGRLQTNQVVIPADGKQDSSGVAYLYSHPLASEWDLAGQNIDTALAPGETVEVYLPTEPSVRDRLTGEVLWRVHFRKGYSPAGYGVTTVIEVAFSADDVARSAAG